MEMRGIRPSGFTTMLVIAIVLLATVNVSPLIRSEELPSKWETIEGITGYSKGMVDAITRSIPLVERELTSRPKEGISPELEEYLIYLYDQFYLYIHANYSHERYGFYTQLALEPYFEIIEGAISSEGRNSITKLVILDEVAAEAAKRIR